MGVISAALGIAGDADPFFGIGIAERGRHDDFCVGRRRDRCFGDGDVGIMPVHRGIRSHVKPGDAAVGNGDERFARRNEIGCGRMLAAAEIIMERPVFAWIGEGDGVAVDVVAVVLGIIGVIVPCTAHRNDLLLGRDDVSAVAGGERSDCFCACRTVDHREGDGISFFGGIILVGNGFAGSGGADEFGIDRIRFRPDIVVDGIRPGCGK